MNSYVNLNIFISSASDVIHEREYAKEIITEVNKTINEPLGITLNIQMWEDMIPRTPDIPQNKIQDMINKKMEECSIIVIILWNRYGEIGKKRTRSNLDIEISKAIEMVQKSKESGKGITLLTYFRYIEDNKDQGPQQKKVIALRNNMQKQDIFYKEYHKPLDFKEKFTHDLYRMSMRFIQSVKKKDFLRKFWDLGISEDQIEPHLAIIYPLLDLQFMKPIDKKRPFWQQKMYPDISFTEFKSLQKIIKTIRLVGRINFCSYDGQHLPETIDEVNCVWICIPRNAMGRNRLDRYKDISKFEFIKRNGTKEGHLLWRHNLSSPYFDIRSPYSKYLELQRDVKKSNWSKEKTKIIVKDFGIVSRFTMPDNNNIATKGFLKDFFIAGIRGLGTWGAAWFVDRKYSEIKNTDADIQLLLEVTYEDGRITNVIDVSNKPKSYFEKQLSSIEIKRTIKKFQNDRDR